MRASSPRRLILFGAALALLVVGAAAVILGAWQLLRPAVSGENSPVFAPIQEGEFLVIVAPFQRGGGDPQPIGTTIANDLRQSQQVRNPFRVESLPRAPRTGAIDGILKTYSPIVLVVGEYDGVDVVSDVYFASPGFSPAPPSERIGNAALLPSTAPLTFHLYAPQGNEKPWAYLEAWIVAQSHYWRGGYTQALPLLQETQRLLPQQTPLAERADMDAFASYINAQLGYIAGPVQSNWQAAKDYYSAALRQNPADPLIAVGLAAALAQTGEPAGAEQLLVRTLRQYPDAWQIYVGLGQIALQRGDTAAAPRAEPRDEAWAAYDQAISRLTGSNDPTLRRALADIYFDRGYYRLTHNDPTGAATDLQQTVALGRDDVYAQSSLAWAAYLTGDYKTAVQASAVAAQLAPDRPELAFNKGLLLLAASDIAAANSAYDEAIAATLKIDDVIKRSTYFGGAYQDLEQLLQKRPDLEKDLRAIQQRIDIANG